MVLAGEVEVTGSESVRVGSMGAIVELAGASDSLEHVGFVWRSSASFDGYAVGLPSPITDVVEVIVVGGGSGAARVASRGGTTVWLELQSVSGSWTRVWSSTLGGGSHSLDGLHVAFEQQDVAGVRFGSEPKSGPSFEGWGEVVLHFGRAVGSGAVHVFRHRVCLRLLLEESVSVSSGAVSVSAGGVLDVSSGEAVHVVSEAVTVESSSVLEASSESVSVVAGSRWRFSAAVLHWRRLGLRRLRASGTCRWHRGHLCRCLRCRRWFRLWTWLRCRVET